MSKGRTTRAGRGRPARLLARGQECERLSGHQPDSRVPAGHQRGRNTHPRGVAVAQINAFASDERWMQTLRANPVSRMRAAGRTHPRRNENQPAEPTMRDPGAARPLRPPRLQAPAHAAAEAAVYRCRDRERPRGLHRANPNTDATTDPPVKPIEDSMETDEMES